MFAIVDDSDPDWYQLCHLHDPSITGMAPKSYFTVVEKIDSAFTGKVLLHVDTLTPDDAGMDSHDDTLTPVSPPALIAPSPNGSSDSGIDTRQRDESVKATVLYQFTALAAGELTVEMGTVVKILAHNMEWFLVELKSNKQGLVPMSYCQMTDYKVQHGT